MYLAIPYCETFKLFGVFAIMSSAATVIIGIEILWKY